MATTQESREHVLQLLRKLKAHEESAREIGSLAEAEVFAAKISELLVKHKLEMSEVEQVVIDEVDPIDEQYTEAEQIGIKRRRKRIAWQEELASVIAVAHFCRVLVAPKTNSLWWVGRASDRQICIFLFTVIARQVESYVDKEYQKRYHKARSRGTENQVRGWRAGFYKGLIERLRARFIEKRRMAVFGAVAKAAHSTIWGNRSMHAQALVVLNRADETVQEYVAERYKNKHQELGFSYRDSEHWQGILEGRVYADGLPVTARGIKGQETSRPILTPPRKDS